MMEIAQLLLGLGVLATFGVLVWLGRKLEKDRTVKISQLAAGLGLEFHPLGDTALHSSGSGSFTSSTSGTAANSSIW